MSSPTVAVNIESIAIICHQANKTYCESQGDFSQVEWGDAPENIKQSAIDGVMFIMANPKAGQSASHENWMDFKLKDGWKFGEVKDAEKKTHPCLIPYDQLPKFQQQKDRLFISIVKSFI